MQVPSITNSGHSTRIRHREFLTDVQGTVAFATLKYHINPGVQASFPWLSQTAQFYESYRFVNLCFKFESTRSTAADGGVYGSIDFDASDSAPVSKQAMMNTEDAIRANVWQEFNYKSSQANLKKFALERYTRKAILAPNQDIKTYDVGTFFLGTSGCTANTIGELYVEYDIILSTPQIPGTVSTDTNIDYQESEISSNNQQFIVENEIMSQEPFYFGPKVMNVIGNVCTFLKEGYYLVSCTLATAATIADTVGSSVQVLGSGAVSGHVFEYLVKALVQQTLVFGGVVLPDSSPLRSIEVRPMISEASVSYMLNRLDRKRKLSSSSAKLTYESFHSLPKKVPDNSATKLYESDSKTNDQDLVKSIMLSDEQKRSNNWVRVNI